MTFTDYPVIIIYIFKREKERSESRPQLLEKIVFPAEVRPDLATDGRNQTEGSLNQAPFLLNYAPIPSERNLAVIRREYMVFLAGPIAEGILSGKCAFKDIFPLLGLPVSPADGNQGSVRVFWKMQFVETKLLIYAPQNWRAVKALAKELLAHSTIQYQAARRIIRQAMEDYPEGVRNGISALHYSGYSDFVKRVSDEKVKIKERVRTATSEIMRRRR